MEAASKGAKSKRGLIVEIVPQNSGISANPNNDVAN
jgi:hypothetical protein